MACDVSPVAMFLFCASHSRFGSASNSLPFHLWQCLKLILNYDVLMKCIPSQNELSCEISAHVIFMELVST